LVKRRFSAGWRVNAYPAYALQQLRDRRPDKAQPPSGTTTPQAYRTRRPDKAQPPSGKTTTPAYRTRRPDKA